MSISMIIKQHSTLTQQSEAYFSDCEKYRYWLRRDWDTCKDAISFLMLNPSTLKEITYAIRQYQTSR